MSVEFCICFFFLIQNPICVHVFYATYSKCAYWNPLLARGHTHFRPQTCNKFRYWLITISIIYRCLRHKNSVPITGGKYLVAFEVQTLYSIITYQGKLLYSIISAKSIIYFTYNKSEIKYGYDTTRFKSWRLGCATDSSHQMLPPITIWLNYAVK